MSVHLVLLAVTIAAWLIIPAVILHLLWPVMGRARLSRAPVTSRSEEGTMTPNNYSGDTQAETVRSGTDVNTLCQQITERGSPELIAAFPQILNHLNKQSGKWTPQMFTQAVDAALSKVGAGGVYRP